MFVKRFKWIFRHPLLLLSFLFFTVRLINLTIIPVFNDEAIYLDWGWRELTNPRMLFYSLYDAKPPLLMWLFGLSTMLFGDAVWAGRFAGVLFGFLTMTGIYAISRRVFDRRIAIVASLFYIITPLFAFFDRQALMESAVSAVGVWSCYFVLRLWQKAKLIDAICLGIVLGLGYFIKGSSLVFFVLAGIFLLVQGLAVKKLIRYLLLLLSTVWTALVVITPLIAQLEFWKTLPSNSRFSLTMSELAAFPFDHWLGNGWANLQIAFFHLTPPLFILAIIGVILVFKDRTSAKLLVAEWVAGGLMIQIFVVRVVIERYVVSFLPLVCLMAAYGLMNVFDLVRRINRFGFVLSLVSCSLFLLWPLWFTGLQIIAPLDYFASMRRFTVYAQQEYVTGVTSGYGLDEVVGYLKSEFKRRHGLVGIGLKTGNPESGLIALFLHHPSIQVVYFDGRLLSAEAKAADCFTSSLPVYYVSRNRELTWLDKYLVLKKEFRSSVNGNLVGIYELRSDCAGTKYQLF